MESNVAVIYRVDDADTIVFTNAEWDKFAQANNSAHLSAERVIGRSLWDFVSDASTQQLYRDILKRVRGGTSCQFTFRCDAPDCRRLMEMVVAPAEGGLSEFQAHTLSIEMRSRQMILDSARKPSAETLHACSWCNKIKVGDEWSEVEKAVAQLRLFETPALPLLSHGICNPCADKIKSIL